MGKKKVLFVGSFEETSKDGGVGGQMFACRTIVNSAISASVEWTLIDTTADSNILSSVYKRINKAILRVIKFCYRILFFKQDYILIFVADGLSFWEKGFMGLVAKCFSKAKVVLAPRSGFIINDIEKDGALNKFIKLVFNKVDTVICQSQYWKSLFEQCINKKDDFKFVIIENMIDFEKYSALPIKSTQGDEMVVILFMAWVTESKGIYELIDAVRLLKNEITNFKVIVAGKGDGLENVGNMILNYGLSNEVELRGWVLGDEKMSLLKDSDIFVLPTYFDGYPNSLMEAKAAGKACIATNVGSIPDMIENMKTGILIDEKNSVQLYEALKMLIQNSEFRESMALSARKQVEETNSIKFGLYKFQKIFN